jgi:hypothetical protein
MGQRLYGRKREEMNSQWSDEVKECYIKDQAFLAECTARGIQICTDVNTQKWVVRNHCPHCEYNKKRAHNWRKEVYRLCGHPLPIEEEQMTRPIGISVPHRKVEEDDDIQDYKKPWVGLTDEEIEEVERWVEFKEEGSGRIPIGKLVAYISNKLRSKNYA